MHRHRPFCCTSSVPDQTSSSIISLPPSSTPKRNSSTRSDDAPPPPRSANHLKNLHRPGVASAPAAEVKLNELMCSGMCGVLYKWASYGKGWRPRWFVLQDGVLSYYKIHGPNKIVVIPETRKGFKVIGDISHRIVDKSTSNTQSQQVPHKPVGEIHLKVSSIHESKSDDMKFSIYTGTKRVHLRAESRENRGAWLESLKVVKNLFPWMSNSELMAPIDNLSVSTDKLRQWLLEEGVREEAIQDSEEIMRNEFANMHNQLLLLKQKQRVLVDTLRQLEVYNMNIRKHCAKRNSFSVSPTTLQNTSFNPA